ncbi:hypothetical protein LCGC14_2071920 [marine sediment metagenome]|uniref:Uncharacterized protein n=1 Tax=marine sediment metagenome TaxID=412755 RepID=A0A0F9F5G9_9ZZZZ
MSSFQAQQIGCDGLLNNAEVVIIQPVESETISVTLTEEIDVTVEVTES